MRRDAHDDLADGQERIHEFRLLWYGVGGRNLPQDEQRPAGHPVPAAAGPASSRSVGAHVGEDAVGEAEPSTDRPTSTNGTGLSEWAVTGLPGGVAHDVGVAVVGGDREQRAGRGRVVGVDGLDRGDHAAEAAHR